RSTGGADACLKARSAPAGQAIGSASLAGRSAATPHATCPDGSWIRGTVAGGSFGLVWDRSECGGGMLPVRCNRCVFCRFPSHCVEGSRMKFFRRCLPLAALSTLLALFVFP